MFGKKFTGATGQDDTGKFLFGCKARGCEFTSSGWDTKEQASARGAEHINEHKTGELMTELTAFEASVGFVRGE